MLTPRQVLTLTYPTSTLVQTSEPLYRPRKIRVMSVRDLVAEPLTIDEYLYRPLIRRGRYLVTAWDYATRSMRQFYPANSLEFARDCHLRIGAYYPGSTRPDKILSRGYANTVSDRIALAKALQEFRRLPNPHLIRVFADDLVVAAEEAA